MNRTDVIIVGGGWAGLAAATKLAETGLKVTLLERSAYLGGRASSFRDRISGEWLDHGTHVFIGAYKSSISLLKTWRAEDGVSFKYGGEIPWILRGGRIERLKLVGKGGTLGFAAGLLSFKGMSMGDRLKTIKAAKELLNWKNKENQTDVSVEQYLSRFGINGRSCGGLWDSLAKSVLNAPLNLASMNLFVNAFREGLLVGGDSARIGLTTQPLKSAYVDKAVDYLTEKQVSIKSNSSVKSINCETGTVSSVDVNGKEIPSRACLLAVPPEMVLKLLPFRFRELDFFDRFSKFEYSPIATVHIQFDRPVMTVRYGLLSQCFTHWVFARGERKDGLWSKMSAMISHAPDRREMSTGQITEKVIADIHNRLPETADARIKSVRAVRTIRATVLLKPGSEKLRPINVTPIKGLYLAGDWCNTGLPATIESAARSGINAAEKIIQEFS